MIRHDYRVAGEPVTINVLEHIEDLEPLRAWFRDHGNRIIACDTETSGLKIYRSDFELRHVQFGDGKTGWVLPYARFARPIAGILNHPGYRFVFHNAPFDVSVLHRFGIVDGYEFAERTEDTQLLAHLNDPRPRKDGGVGLGLKDNCAHHVDPTAVDTAADLKKRFVQFVRTNDDNVRFIGDMDTKQRAAFRKGLRAEGLDPKTVTVDEGWRYIPLFDPIYTLYAGLDVIYTHRLLNVLKPRVHRACMSKLSGFEHDLQQQVGVPLMLRGMVADTEYLTGLGARFERDIERHTRDAAAYGVPSLGSTTQAAEAFLKQGERLYAKTKTGAWSIDKTVLCRLADLNEENEERLYKREPNPLAMSIFEGKRRVKWKASYVDNTLSRLDKDGILHVNLMTLKARTARMSIADPPYQQLPSSDPLIRSGIIGRPGNLIVGCDYDQVEMRVAAAFSGERVMTDAIRNNISQHAITAKALFGDAFVNKHDSKREYDIAKMVGFGSVYGGGAPTLAKQSGLPLAKCQEIVAMFRETYPALTQWKREIGAQVLEDALSASELTKHRKCTQLMFEAETDEDRLFWRREASAICRGKYATITTPIGRVLPVEAEFAYKVSNYYVQSTARDVLASALLRLVDSSLSPGLLLPIHDEVLAEAPAAEATEYAHEMERIMSTEFMGVPLSAEGKVHGRSWGDGYKR